MDGRKDILGVWIGENESAKFWLSVMNDLKNRGVKDVYVFCVDGLTGFDSARPLTRHFRGHKFNAVSFIRYARQFVM